MSLTKPRGWRWSRTMEQINREIAQASPAPSRRFKRNGVILTLENNVAEKSATDFVARFDDIFDRPFRRMLGELLFEWPSSRCHSIRGTDLLRHSADGLSGRVPEETTDCRKRGSQKSKGKDTMFKRAITFCNFPPWFGLLAIRNAPKKGAGGGVGAFRTSKRTFTSSEIGASSGGDGPRVARRGGSWPGKVHVGTRRGHSWFFGPGKCPHLFRGDSGPGSGDVSPGLAAVSSPSS